jgi:hypothetical protein
MQGMYVIATLDVEKQPPEVTDVRVLLYDGPFHLQKGEVAVAGVSSKDRSYLCRAIAGMLGDPRLAWTLAYPNVQRHLEDWKNGDDF